MNNILSLINPARIIKVEDAMKIAERFDIPIEGIDKKHLQCVNAIDLLQKFESLYALKLEKGHFVCEVEPTLERIKAAHGDESAFKYEHDRWKLEQARVIFEGFEEGETTIVRGHYIRIGTIMFDGGCLINLTRTWIKPTIRDLLTEIEKYNETATIPIELKYTSNIFSLLKIEG